MSESEVAAIVILIYFAIGFLVAGYAHRRVGRMDGVLCAVAFIVAWPIAIGAIVRLKVEDCDVEFLDRIFGKGK